MAHGGETKIPERINDELLSCSICFGTYSLHDKQPKLLPCSHTFCIECIDEYLKSQGRNSKSKGKFPCPVCRKENVLSKNGIQDLPNNITILGLLDVFKDTKRPQNAENIVGYGAGAGPSLYPSLPQDVEPYVPGYSRAQPPTSLSDSGVEIPIIEADPNKCYECAKPKPSVTLKCGHSICKTCKRKRQITKANQSMCPLCIDLQAASMMLMTSENVVVQRPTETAVSMETVPTQPNQPAAQVIDKQLDSPMEADRPPAFNPAYEGSGSVQPTAPVLVMPVTPTRAAPPPPPRPSYSPADSPAKSIPVENSPRGSQPPPPPPPRRLPGEILGSPLKCIKKIGSYSEVRMQTNAFKAPTKLSMYKTGNFIVVDEDLMTVQVFNAKGEYLSMFKVMGVRGACFYTPDRIVVATHRKIETYSMNGTPLGESEIVSLEDVVPFKFGFIGYTKKSISFYSQDLTVYKDIKKKVKPGVFQRASNFESIKNVTITTQNEIAVLDSGEIYVLNEDGQIKLTYTPATESCGALVDPYSITFDRYNNLYVSDTGNKRVLKFYANGRFSRCVLDFALGNPSHKDVKTSVYGLASGDDKHIVIALSGNKTAEVRLYEV